MGKRMDEFFHQLQEHKIIQMDGWMNEWMKNRLVFQQQMLNHWSNKVSSDIHTNEYLVVFQV